MTKSSEEIQDAKIASIVKRSSAKTKKAIEAVLEAKAAQGANTKAGKSVIRQRNRAADKARVSQARHECDLYERELAKLVIDRLAPRLTKKPRRF